MLGFQFMLGVREAMTVCVYVCVHPQAPSNKRVAAKDAREEVPYQNTLNYLL